MKTNGKKGTIPNLHNPHRINSPYYYYSTLKSQEEKGKKTPKSQNMNFQNNTMYFDYDRYLIVAEYHNVR